MHHDLIVKNAHIHIMDDAGSVAQSIGVKDGRISAIDPGAEATASRVVDAGGRTLLPGFIDAHAHMEMLAYGWHIAVDHRSPAVKSIDDIVERLAAKARTLPAGQWILGQGNHYQDLMLVERRYPTRYDLDRASMEHPIVCRFSFHINIFNSKAMELLGITRATPDMAGGHLDRDPDTGEPTGKTNDMYHALGGPDWPLEQVCAGLLAAQKDYLSHGVTALGEFPLLAGGVPAFLALAERDALKLRVTVWPKAPDVVGFEEAYSGAVRERFEGVDPGRLRLAGIKLFLDGGLTSMAAALHEPYATDPSHSGALAFEPEEFCEIVRRLDAAGHQVTVHAIGDRALDTALDAFCALPAPRDPTEGPHRIEHAGNAFWNDERRDRFRASRVLPVPQPPFIYTTAPGYSRHLGAPRNANLFAFRTLLDQGFAVPGNSDAIGVHPEQHVPLFGIWCMIRREMGNGEFLSASEAITVSEALRMYTRNAAAALGMGHELGSLELGKRADFIAFDRDPMSVPVDDLRHLRVAQTWVSGDLVHEAA